MNGETAVAATGDAIPIEIRRGPASLRIMARDGLVSDREPQAFDGAETFASRCGDLAVKLRPGHGS